MHWLDTTLLAALSLGAALGFASGLFWQLARIASFASAVYVTMALHDSTVELLGEHLLRDANAGVIRAAAYLFVFLGAYLCLFLVARLLRMWVRSSEMAPMDRLLGALLGMAKVAIVAAAACWIMPYCPQAGPKEWHDSSTLAPVLTRGLDAALSHVPEEYKQSILEGFESWRNSAVTGSAGM
jgi:membrane protein required for colicin V production